MTKRSKSKITSRKQTKAAIERALRSGPIRRRPRAAQLPGMEDVFDPVLGPATEAIAEIRRSKAELESAEAGHLATSLRRLRELKRWTFTANGVELARVAGEETLRCRVTARKPIVVDEDQPAPALVEADDVRAMDTEQQAPVDDARAIS